MPPITTTTKPPMASVPETLVEFESLFPPTTDLTVARVGGEWHVIAHLPNGMQLEAEPNPDLPDACREVAGEWLRIRACTVMVGFFGTMRN